jgi:hypothetical protein
MSRTRAVSVAQGEARSEMRSTARGRVQGESRGISASTGESEALVPVIEWMPSQLYSLPEQLHRLAGEIQNLALREVYLKVDNAAPVRTRTTTTPPAFSSPAFRRLFLPLFHQAALRRSNCLFPVAEVDALIARHLAELTPTYEADIAPEPMPIIDDPEAFAARFWAKRGRRTLRIVKDDGDKET